MSQPAVELLEREAEFAALGAVLEESRREGRVVLVMGESGIGKTALVTTAVRAAQRNPRVLWGACDALVVPRPQGPFHDVARQVGGPLAEAMAGGSRERVLAALLDELGGREPTALVIEDVHWADDATLDLVTLLAGRLAHSHGCLILTCRNDELDDRPELRRALGALPRACLRRIEPAPLSDAAVASLAQAAGREPADLHGVTGGNPFFVTEALAVPPGRVPTSVREAVMLRVSALPEGSRAVVELVAVVPGRTERWLPEEVAGAPVAAIDACLAAGMLELAGDALAFRHELARRAVEEAVGPLWRRELNRKVLAALERRGGADVARLAHHARQAGDAAAIGRLVPAAARAASAAGSHHQALEHWEAALAADDGRDRTARAAAVEGVAFEAYLCGDPERALAARRTALELHEAAGDTARVGESLRWLARLLWWSGRNAEATEAGKRALAVLETLPPGRELAMALSGQSQLAMLAERDEQAIALGTRAIELARRLDDRDTLMHALTNVGTTRLGGPDHENGRAQLEEVFALAAAGGAHDHAARALVNLTTATLQRQPSDARIRDDLDRALRFARQHELEGYLQYVLGTRANLRMLTGEWAEGEQDARASLALGSHPGISVCPALHALGRLQARRGEPDAGDTLDEAWRRALKTGELQRIAPASAARAEHAWLDGDLARTVAATSDAYALAVELGHPWAIGELAFWRWRAGALTEPVVVDGPYGRSIAGDWRGAAAAWEALGFPYEAADALTDGDDEDAQRAALDAFDRLGAARAGLRLRRRLRASGVRNVPRGPRRVSRAAPAGLTPRQVDVLRLLATGATNAEIAERLVIAPKTVDHHVSAVLTKLGVRSRVQAAGAAARLGLDPAQAGEQPVPR